MISWENEARAVLARRGRYAAARRRAARLPGNDGGERRAGGDRAVALGRARRDGDGDRRRALCARHVRRHGDLQRAPEQRACRGRSGKPRGRLAVGAFSDGLDVVEPRADGLIHGGLRAVYSGDCGKVGQRCRQTKAAPIRAAFELFSAREIRQP